jgi:integrase
MSVHGMGTQKGKSWKVRWREGGRARSATFDSKRDALDFDAEIRRRKRIGTLAELDAGKQTIGEFTEKEWWPLHAERNLSARTREVYAYIYDAHLLPRVGGTELRAFTAHDGARLRADMEAAGIGPAAVRKALMLLQGIFTYAVRWGHLQINPMVAVAKPSGKRRRAVAPPSPAMIEAMRTHLRSEGRLLDATLITVLAYAGLRPGEALALSWAHVRERVLLVERALSDGVFKETKTREFRTVELVAPLAADLAEWRLASGRPAEDRLVFPTRRGAPWTTHDWQNWTRRTFKPTAESAGLLRARPYDLRHAFCSLLIREHRETTEIARQAGHAPSMTYDTYGHVIEEMRGTERVTAEAAIRAARNAHVSEKCPRPTELAATDGAGA